MEVCHDHLRRTDLIAAVSGHIEIEWRLRRGRPRLLSLTDEQLLAWAGDLEAMRRYEAFDADLAIDRLLAAGLSPFCSCSSFYPEPLRELPDPPAVLHVLGDPDVLHREGVAIVGARTASDYGRELARGLARGLAAAEVVVVSGMAMGIDATAHAATLDAGGTTVAVLGCGADSPYPVRSRELHRRIAGGGCVVSELPPGTPPRRWTFPARNRLIAALSRGTVVVEGGERSGSLITADFAAELGRFVAAMPGPVHGKGSGGPHLLIKAGAELVRDARDVLELLHGVTGPERPMLRVVVGAGDPPPELARAEVTAPADLGPGQLALLDAIGAGAGSVAELLTPGADAREVVMALGELELRGLVRRVFGGRYVRATG